MPAKKAAASPAIPQTIRIRDQFGEPYDIDPENKLWEDALKRHQAGEESIQYPISQITNAVEWGWWSCFQAQREWLQNSGIPVPDHKLLYGIENADNQKLREYLALFGGYVSWLESQIGIFQGRLAALDKGYKTAVLVHSAKSEDKKATETSKEAAAIAGSETLKQTKRNQIETETIIATAKGLLASYTKAWETVSRIVTIRMQEMELGPRRIV